jgi:hypothetical protein
MFLSGASLSLWSSYLCLLHSWSYTCVPPCLACSLRKGLANILPGLALNFYPPVSTSWVGGITAMNHHAQPIRFFYLYTTAFQNNKDVGPDAKLLNYRTKMWTCTHTHTHACMHTHVWVCYVCCHG